MQPAPPTTQRKGLHSVAAKIVATVLALVVFGAVVFATLVYRSYRELKAAKDFTNLSSTAEFTAVPSSIPGSSFVDRRVVESTDDPALGPANAKVTIVEFGDFQCPFCRESVATVKQLLEKYGNKIRFIYRDFPNSSIHDNALNAALAAACAHTQGKFWQYHDVLYLHQENLSQTDLLGYAGQLQMDTAMFQQCLLTQQHKQEVDDDFQAGTDLGVSGTPTWFINGHRVEGAIPFATFDKIVKYGLKGKL